ncbi:MAG: CopG family transcriptional regulator [Syntrophorhabdus sp.]|nr:CopG family transcriptional regulator [Syntrophorhabdus sp.]OPX99239.1 MAG: Ribbon-helix-helix protein, copG family [Syntrophorhabdus sp. PtaB.Bin047]
MGRFKAPSVGNGVDEHAVESQGVHMKNPGGRPKKSPEERLVKVTIYMTPEEKARLDARARKLGVSVSALIKMKIAEEGERS